MSQLLASTIANYLTDTCASILFSEEFYCIFLEVMVIYRRRCESIFPVSIEQQLPVDVPVGLPQPSQDASDRRQRSA